MSSFQFSLRRFITERLAAVAEEISSEVEKRILQYQKEISTHQLLKVTQKPEIRGHIVGMKNCQLTKEYMKYLLF